MDNRRNAKFELPDHEEVKTKAVGGTPDDIVDAVRNHLMAPLMAELRTHFVKTYSRSLSADDVDRMTEEEILGDKRFAKVCDDNCKDVYACAKLVHKLLNEYEADYKKFMKHLDKIWQSYCTMPFLKGEWDNVAPYRKKYWDSKEGKPRKLSDVMANEERANSPPAPASLVHDVEVYVFDDLLTSLIKYTKEDFKKTAPFQDLTIPKFKYDTDFGLYIIDSRNADCYNAFRAFCESKGKAYQAKFDCVVLLNKAMKNKDNYQAFMTHFHGAYKYIAKKDIVSEDARKKMKKCYETYWNAHTNEPQPLRNDIQG